MKQIFTLYWGAVLSILACSCSPASNNDQNYTYKELIFIEAARIEKTINPDIQNTLASLLNNRLKADNIIVRRGGDRGGH